jgi:RimJ/RimL family protein N-acetyltransferase
MLKEHDMTWAELAATTLENQHVLLRPLQEADRASLHSIVFDPAIWRYFVFAIETDEDFNSWFDRALAERRAGRRVTFCITDKRNQAVAGSMSFSNFTEADLRLEIGASWLSPSFQGKGVNHGAKFLMLCHAFEVLGAERVEFKTDVLNAQARRALSKVGATEEGVLRSYNFNSVLRSEWPSVKLALLAAEG